jgi:hypothetical protein
MVTEAKQYLEQLRKDLHDTLYTGLKMIYSGSPPESLHKLAQSFTNMSLGNITGQQVNEATLQTLTIWESIYKENHLDLIERFKACNETYALIKKAVDDLMRNVQVSFN